MTIKEATKTILSVLDAGPTFESGAEGTMLNLYNSGQCGSYDVSVTADDCLRLSEAFRVIGKKLKENI